MYRWHFVRIAEVFRKVHLQLKAEDVEDTYQFRLTVKAMMDMLQADNPRFNREIFIDHITNGPKGGATNGQSPGVRAADATRRTLGDGPEGLL
jgi:hypothetical protein